MKEILSKITTFLYIAFIVIFACAVVWYVLASRQPHIIEDKGNFAIVEYNEEIYIWNKDIDGGFARWRESIGPKLRP